MLRRVWLLSDGIPNPRSSAVLDLAKDAYRLHCNVNCIGFGDPRNFDEELLRRISATTHRGKYVSARSLEQLRETLVQSDPGVHRRRHHRAEMSVWAIDLSGSMTNPMGKARKIDAVQEALMNLLYYKQRLFA
jgi:hypothetical protein